MHRPKTETEGLRRLRAGVARVATAAFLLLLAPNAHAAPAYSVTSGGHPVPAQPPPKRAVPDYDGRSPPPASAAESTLWIPRIVLFPVHVVMESFVRKPLVALVTAAEDAHVAQWLARVFTWNDGRAGLFPTVFWELGFRPSVGFYFFYDELFHPRHDFVMHGGFWTDNWQQLKVDSRVRLFHDGSGTLGVSLDYVNRPDRIFYGIGADTRKADRTYYRERLFETRVHFEGELSGLSRLRVGLTHRFDQFARGQSPSIEEKHDIRNPREVPRFDDFNFLEGRIDLILDSRGPDRLTTSGSGVLFQPSLALGGDPSAESLHWLRWSAELAGFLDVSGGGHVLGLRVFTEQVEPTGDEDIPFNELPSLGGLERLRGYPDGRFRGYSTLTVTVQYRYPIWAFLDAELFVSAGNAFDRHLRDFSIERLHLAWGLAVRTNTARSLSFDVLLGFGTNRLDSDPVKVDQIHFAIGVNHGF